jgi:hypothetical protein
MSRRYAANTALAGLALAGCGNSVRATAPLGRSIAASRPRPAPVPATPAPIGDPPAERAGTIPATAQAAENAVTPAGVANTPQLALRRYALTYTNWHSSSLHEREQQLAAISIGAPKLTAEQTAAARSGANALIANNVANSGQVVAITPGEGPDAGQWIIVTEEHTTGTGMYAGLPPAPHVTLGRVSHLDGGWVVSAWNPAS